MRLVATAISVLVCVALSGCGADDRAGSVRATADAGIKSGLGTERFNALDRVYTTSLPLDRPTQGAIGASRFAVAARRAREACDAVGQVDALLGPVARFCSLGLDLDEQIVVFNGCYPR